MLFSAFLRCVVCCLLFAVVLGSDRAPLAADDVTARDTELQLLRLYREGKKKDLIARMMRESITRDYHIHPSFGRTVFMEFTVKNPFAHEERFAVTVDDPLCELHLVTDASEWRFLRDVLPLSAGDEARLRGPLSDLTWSATHELLLMGQEEVTVPLVFRSFHSGALDTGDRHPEAARKSMAERAVRASAPSAPVRARVVPVSVSSAGHGHTVALVRVHVHPQPYPVHRTLRYFHPENEYLQGKVYLPVASSAAPVGVAAADAQTVTVHCAERDVVLEASGPWDKRLLRFKFRCVGLRAVVFVCGQRGRVSIDRTCLCLCWCLCTCSCGGAPATSQFFFLLYHDRYMASLKEVWRVVVHSTRRHDLHATMGQAVVSDLTLPGDGMSRRVQVFTSHPWEMSVRPCRCNSRCVRVGYWLFLTSPALLCFFAAPVCTPWPVLAGVGGVEPHPTAVSAAEQRREAGARARRGH